MTLRKQIEAFILEKEEEGHGGDSTDVIRLGHMLDTLDNSREITDKETLGPVPDGTGYGRFFKVVNHKARVVWDD